MPRAEDDEGRRKGAADVSAAVVRHHALDTSDAVLTKPRGGSRAKRRGGALLFVRQQFGVAQPRLIIDRHVEVFPPQARLAVPLLPLTGPETPRVPWRPMRPSFFTSK